MIDVAFVVCVVRNLVRFLSCQPSKRDSGSMFIRLEFGYDG